MNTKYDVTDHLAEPCKSWTWTCHACCIYTSEFHNFKRLNVYKMPAVAVSSKHQRCDNAAITYLTNLVAAAADQLSCE